MQCHHERMPLHHQHFTKLWLERESDAGCASKSCRERSLLLCLRAVRVHACTLQRATAAVAPVAVPHTKRGVQFEE